MISLSLAYTLHPNEQFRVLHKVISKCTLQPFDMVSYLLYKK